MINHISLSACAALLVSAATFAADNNDGWISMFNGKDLSGWKSNEETSGSFSVEEGVIKVSNGRAHLFYTGPTGEAKFQSFEFKAKVKHLEGSNSGLYIHTSYQEKGWPEKGYECQVNSTAHKDPKKTGGLYAVKDVLDKAPVGDGEWFDYHIKVEGKHITISINGQVTTDWTEPEGWDPATALKNMPGRKLSEGTIAIQGHDPKSVVFYKDLFIKVIP
ncbi:MAG: DUF1080 domain-containing protein [Prosthecobacter sp.]|uniref:3-keto-disaccharide hydrolase n=1 Tax=Prosthecobacter sp. TaxID=1965333 RepID=UPI0039021261